MKIGIITYNRHHHKTFQIIKGLLKKKYEITLIISKYKPFKKRKIHLKHRPNQFNGKNIYQSIKGLNLKLRKLENGNIYDDLDYVLVGGSGILKKKYIKKNFIINCHPGLIPQTRGLDSIKWALYNSEIVGNTLHFIDERVDAGKIIAHKVTKLYKSDNLSNFFKRHYKNEINLLINFETYLNSKNKIKLNKKKAHMRMPCKLEKELATKFKNYKRDKLKNA